MRKLGLLWILMISIATATEVDPPVYYVVGNVLTNEDSLALQWLQDSFEAHPIRPENFDQVPDHAIVWVHQPLLEKEAHAVQSLAAQLAQFYQEGGKLLLTGKACTLVKPMGIESKPPQSRPITIAHPEFWQKRGLQAYRGHPLFTGLSGGTYCFQPLDSVTVWRTGYFGSRPEEGQPIAIEKVYVRFLPDTILAWEYSRPNGGQVLCVGAYVNFSIPNVLESRMYRIVQNAITYLGGAKQAIWVTHWPPTLSEVPRRVAAPPSRLGVPRSSRQRLSEVKLRALRLSQTPARQAFWDVGGKRILIMGKQAEGIDEVWAFPYRIVQHYTVQLLVNGQYLAWDSTRTVFTQWPEAVERQYYTSKGILRELIYTHRQSPGAVVRYEWSGKEAVQLVVKFRSDLRWFWPYRQDVRTNLEYAFDATRQAFYYRTADKDVHVWVGADQKPQASIIGPFRKVHYLDNDWQTQPTADNAIMAAAVYELNQKNEYNCTIAMAASQGDYARANSLYRAILVDPNEVLQRQQAYFDSLLTHSLQVESPSERFNKAYQWAVVGLDRFKIFTPGIGTGLMAGFGTTERGWDGGHQVNGRPGYAWYFGRDAVWAALALIANGDTLGVQNQLRLFSRFQSPEGKIFHELTPNGVVHYDAADATPLFVLLAGKYYQATGNLTFLKEIWPAVKRAMQFLESTDWDGDGLIDNYQVGHGWVEGGPLFGGKTTVYLAGLWQVALQHAADMAGAIGEDSLRQYWQKQAHHVAALIETKFYLPTQQYYAHSIDLTDNPLRMLSILPAAIMNFNVLPPKQVERMLMRYASTAFTTDWGVRILSQYDNAYNPAGYHSGSVWPLFTGWLALAEYLYGNDVQGFPHLMQSAQLVETNALGYVDEVLHGERFQPIGVCAHQAWSESAVLNPIYYGLLGIEPHASRDTLYLTPRLPGHWSELEIRNIRVGNTRFDLKIKQGEKRFEYHFRNVEGKPLTVMLTLRQPSGAKLKKVDGTRHRGHFKVSKNGWLTPRVPVQLNPGEDQKIKVHFSGGIRFFPAVAPPAEGQESRGLRILAIQRNGPRFIITVEAKGGHDQYLGVRTFRQAIRPVKGAFLEPGLHRNEYWLRILTPKFTEQYVQKTVILELVNE